MLMLGCTQMPLASAILLCILIWIPGSVVGDTNPNDVSALNVLFTNLNNPNQLQGWTANGGDPCGQQWQGITCSGSSVTNITLSNLGLSGTLGYNMNNLNSLIELDMSNNNLGGNSQIPYNLPTNLQTLNLAYNQFGQQIPFSILQMGSLQYLNLAHNQLQGNLSDSFGGLTSITTMDLSFNSLAGDLPQSFSSLQSLTSLYLQNNQFTGHIDVLASLPLQNLNVENNHFTGWIPNQFNSINIQTGGNSWSSGPAPPPPPYTSPPASRKTSPGSGGHKSSNGGGISGGGIAGIIITILVVGGVIAFFLIRRKSKKSSRGEVFEQAEPFAPLASNDAKEMKAMEPSSTFNSVTFQPTMPISLKPPPVGGPKSLDENDFANKYFMKKNSSIKATVYSVADLQIATDSFSMDNLIGEGSFGRIYRAHFDDGEVLAVKKIFASCLPNEKHDDFIELVSNISRLRHQNLSELVGYCSEHGQCLLVYEFHKNGSLQDLLHLSDEYSKPLSWGARVKIALGTARALEYLHEVCAPSIVHKNLKSSNILLDTEFNPHLSDCGFESLVPNTEFQTADRNISSPEVAMSGQYTLKSDVYSFGVVMLELMTGRKPFDSLRPRSEQSLVRWATPQLHDIDALDRMVDPALKGLYPAKSLSRFADVIALCVQPEPEFRPPMSEVVQQLVRLVQRANMTKRTVGGEGQDRRADEQDDFIY